MSLPVLRDVCLEEGSVLNLIREYFELGGHAECLLALEHSCSGVTPQPPLPMELAVLREIVLAGKWDHVMKYLDRFKEAEEGSEEGLKRCKYLAHRQKYLEILHHVESDIQDKLRLGFGSHCKNGKLLDAGEADKIRSVMEAELKALEPLCPCPEDYQSLQALLSMPSISSSKNFASWQLHSGRLEALYEIQEWITKTLYLNVKFSLQEAKSAGCKEGVARSCSLMRLLAKGLLYEQCERLCRARCGGELTTGDQGTLLDLRGWLQHQPDSSFQLPPSQLSLVITPWSRPSSSLMTMSVDMGVVKREQLSLMESTYPATKSVSSFHPLATSSTINQSATDFHSIAETNSKSISAPHQTDNNVAMVAATSANKEKTGVKSSHLAGAGQQQRPCAGRRESHGEEDLAAMAEARSPSPRPSSGEPNQPEKPLKVPPLLPAIPAVSNSTSVTAKPSQSNGLLPSKQLQNIGDALAKDVKKSLRLHTPPDTDKIEPDGPPSPVAGDEGEVAVFFTSTTPLRKTGRGSSTPKNPKASRASLKSSPPSSPIVPVHAPNSPGPDDENTNGVVNGIGPVEQGARRRIDFTSQEQRRWPVATLLSTVKDAQAVRSVAFSGSGKVIAVGANSGTLRLCHTTSLGVGEDTGSKELPVFYEHPRHHRGSIYCLAWYQDAILASGSNDKTISLLTYSSGTSETKFKVQKPFPVHTGTIRDVVFTTDGLLAYAGGVSSDIIVTDVNTFKGAVSLNGHMDQVLALGVLPGGLLASGAQDNTVLLWDMRSPLPVSSLDVGATVASLTSSGDHLVISHLDGSCSVYNLNTFKRLSTYKAHTKECRSVRYHPNAKIMKNLVLSGSYDHSVSLTDTETLQWTKLCEHSDKVIQCRWHPEGNIFASTGADKRACFWRLSN